MKTPSEELEALGDDAQRHEDLHTAVGELINQMKVDAKRCGICMGPCPLFTQGATPCRLVPPDWHDRNAEMGEMLSELMTLRENHGLPNDGSEYVSGGG